MFDCRSCSNNSDTDCVQQAFARNGGLSLGLTLQPGSVISLLGVEICQPYDLLVYNLSKIVRERIQKMEVVKNHRKLNIRKQRLEITRFLRLVVGNARAMKGEVLCSSTSIIKNCLPKLKSPLLMYGWKSVHERDYVGYEIYHGTLEWRWLTMLLAKESRETIEPINAVGVEGKRNALDTTCKLFSELMIELLELAFHQYRINVAEDLIFESPFHCNCVKLMWLGMMALAHDSKGELNFWTSLSTTIPSVLENRKDGYLFKIWLLRALAQFYYKKIEDEDALVSLVHDYTIIDDTVRELIKMESKEEQVRVFLALLKPIITGLWPVRFETVIILWDYFNVRLNSSFQTKNDSLASIACIPRSVAGFIEQANTIAAPDSTLDNLDCKQNSFRMFLILLSSVMRYCTKQSLKTKVQILFNRIFLKLGPRKYENMTEQAIYNLGLLLLSMISATSYQEDYSRVSRQIQMVRFDESMNLPVAGRINRIVVATRIHMALLVLFGSSRFDKTAQITLLLQNLEIARRMYGNRIQPATEALAEGFVIIFEKAFKKGSFSSGEISLIGSWLHPYLRQSPIDKVREVLGAVSTSLQSRKISIDERFLKAVNDHILPFVKELFVKIEPTPPCVAQIAARLTIHSRSNGTNDISTVLTLFGTFINCPTAHSNQILEYLKEITKHSETVKLLDEKVLIRQWLKMGFYYDHQRLLELSRVIYGLNEFKQLCEIPQYDFFESSAVPIELFFRFVGKRFREVDIDIQLEMKMKLHVLFQHFDKWIPAPKGIIRKRILAVLVLALKECPQAFYIKSNSSCLYHLAFQHFFLPFAILTDRNVQSDFIADMARVWHNVMNILGMMDYNGNPVIGDNVNNMLIKWIPQFKKLTDPDESIRPFLLFFCGRNEQLVLYAMPRFVTMYVDLQRCLPKQHAIPGMQILQRLLDILIARKDYGKISLFIRTTGLSVTLHAFMCNAMFPTRVIAMEILYGLLDCTDGPSNMVKNELKTVLAAFTKKYLPITAQTYFTFMCRLTDRSPNFIRSMIYSIREELETTERLRGQGIDRFLRTELHRLEGAVEASLNKITLNNIHESHNVNQIYHKSVVRFVAYLLRFRHNSQKENRMQPRKWTTKRKNIDVRTMNYIRKSMNDQSEVMFRKVVAGIETNPMTTVHRF